MIDFKKNSEIVSRIMKLEYELSMEIFNGHKPIFGDHLEPKRQEINILRCVLFGYNSQFCKITK